MIQLHSLRHDKDLFLNFLIDISKRKHGDKIDLKHLSETGNTRIVFVGNGNGVNVSGILPYYNFIKKEAENGTDNFFVLSRGNINSWLAKFIVQKLQNEKILTLLSKFKEMEKDEKGEIKIVGYHLAKEIKKEKFD